MKNKKNILVFSIIGVIFLLISLLAYISYKNQEKKDYLIEEKKYEVPNEFDLVNEYSIFFSVSNNINSFLKYYESKNSDAILGILNDDFIDENNIRRSNLYEVLPKLDEKGLGFKAKRMYQKNYDNNILFYVIGDVTSSVYDTDKVVLEDTVYIVLVDYNTVSFELIPIYSNKNYDKLPFYGEKIDIRNNNYNTIIGTNVITPSFICSLYYNDFYNLLINDVEKSYTLLEKNFRKNNYPVKKTYIETIEKNIKNIYPTTLKCDIIRSDSKRVYRVEDLNSNSFTITEESIMNYKIEFNIKN